LLALGGLAAAGAAVAVLVMLPDRRFVLNEEAALRSGARWNSLGGYWWPPVRSRWLPFDGSTQRCAPVLPE
jgi:hypothetical protein